MERVERRPDALVRAEPVEQFFRESRQIAVPVLFLATRELLDDSVSSPFRFVVGEARGAHRASREVMAREVAAQLVVRRLPPSERGGVGGQTGSHAEHVEQPAGVEIHQEAPVHVCRIEERPGKEPHAGQVEGREGNAAFRSRRRDRCGDPGERQGGDRRGGGADEFPASEASLHEGRARVFPPREAFRRPFG